jgi:hypothetical protein
MIVYHEEWGPGLSFACFARMGDLSFKNVPAEAAASAQAKVAAFITRQPLTGQPVRKFSCSDLPRGTTVVPLAETSNHRRFFLRYQVGLMAAVGTLWGIFGPDWAWLGFASALLASGTILALYFVARHFVARVPAAALAAAAGTHPAFVYMIPATRDFGKAFFVIASFAVLLHLVLSSQPSRKQYILTCAALGAFLGIGVGFRQDAVAIALLTALLLFLFPPRGLETDLVRIVKTQAASLAAFMLAVLCFVVPLYWFVPVDHGHEGHFLILGLIDMALNNAGFPVRKFLFNPSYEDYSGYALITAHSMAETGRHDIQVFSRQYNEGSRRQFFEVVSVFPFIAIGRIYTIFLDILTSASLLTGRSGWRLVIGSLSLVALAIAFVRNRRLAVFLVLYLLASSAMLSLQYVDRHYFHIHFLWLVIAFAIVLWAVTKYLTGKFKGVTVPVVAAAERLRALVNVPGSNPSLLDNGATVGMRLPRLVGVGIVLLPVIAFLAEQVTRNRWTARVEASRFESAAVAAPVMLGEPTKGRVLVTLMVDGDRTFTNFAGLVEPLGTAFKRAYVDPTGGFLRARFNAGVDCHGPANMRIVYEAKHSWANMSHVARPHTAPGAQNYYFPAFFVQESRFKGVEFDSTHAACFEGLSWSRDFRDIRLPVEFWSQKPH